MNIGQLQINRSMVSGDAKDICTTIGEMQKNLNFSDVKHKFCFATHKRIQLIVQCKCRYSYHNRKTKKKLTASLSEIVHLLILVFLETEFILQISTPL